MEQNNFSLKGGFIMFRRKNYITICVELEYMSDIFNLINNIDIYGTISEYLDGNKLYITFVTKTKTQKIVKFIESKLYKTEVMVFGNFIYLIME